MNEHDFDEEFLAFKDELNAYLYRLSTNRQDADDLLHDTYLRAKDKLAQFRNNSSVKTWVFTIATNLARDNKRVRNRWAEDVQDICKKAAQSSVTIRDRIFNTFLSQEEKSFDIKEHINYCFTCLAKNLNLDQQIAIILKEVYQFKRSEIAEIMILSEGVVKHLLFDGRKSLQTRYERRCALINKEGVCYQCAELNNGLQSLVKGPRDADQKIAALALNPNDSNVSLTNRLNIISKINPLKGNGAKLEDTILQILRDEINDQ